METTAGAARMTVGVVVTVLAGLFSLRASAVLVTDPNLFGFIGLGFGLAITGLGIAVLLRGVSERRAARQRLSSPPT